MAKKKSVRIVVRKAGVRRCIVTVAELNDDSIVIDVRGRGASSNDGWHPFGIKDVKSLNGSVITEHRYTIHPSKISDNISQINFHYAKSDGTIQENRSFTTAFKQGKLFYCLFSRYCTEMSSSYYDVGKKNREVVDLGTLDGRLTLFYSIIIGPKGKKFPDQCSHFSVRQINFNEFSVIILWSFLTIPAHSVSEYIHILSLNPAAHHAGFTMNECIDFHNSSITKLRDQFIAVLMSNENSAKFERFFKASVFIKTGSPLSREYQMWLSRCRMFNAFGEDFV